MEWRSRIETDPNVCSGRPHVRGTRLTVELLLDLLAAGWNEQTLLAEYPQLAADDLRAVFAFAHDAIRHEYFAPTPPEVV